MDELTKLVRDCFSKQLGEWCARRGVEYIGHIIEDDNAHTRMACSVGHYFREMEGQHMAGIDVVHHQIVPGFTEPVHQWIAGDRDGEFFHFGLAKLASSAAHIQENKKGRALCEIFGNYGWAEGNSMMKWLTNHMLVRGINEFTLHAFSMKYPDFDCPPHFYARGNNPGFACFAQLMKYMNRAADFLSGGAPMMDAAILYHAKAEWSGGSFMYFQKPGRKLMEAQLDYDVIPEDVLSFEKAKVENGELVIGAMRYPCLILPYAERIDAQVASFVKEAADMGLIVFAVDGLPLCDVCGRSLPRGFLERLTLVSLSELADRVGSLRREDRLRVIGKAAEQYLRSCQVLFPDGLAAMYFNESVTEKAEAVLTAGSYRSVTVYDAWNNTTETYGLCGGQMQLYLEPGEAVFLCFEEKESEKSFPVRAEERILDLTWKVSKADELSEKFTAALTIEAGTELPNLNGRGYFPAFTGTYRYEGSFYLKEEEANPLLKEDGQRIWLVLPAASDCVRAELNGTELGHMAGFPGKIELTKALRAGENKLILDVSTTLVWKRKDGASTHLQVAATGITEKPKLLFYEK